MKSEQVRVIYLAYYLVKSVDRELNGLWESIKKEAGEYGGNGVNAPDALKEFKLLVEREIDTLKVPCQLVRECVD